MTETQTLVKYTHERHLMAELMGIATWAGFDTMEWALPSAAEDEPTNRFDAHMGGICLMIPRSVLQLSSASEPNRANAIAFGEKLDRWLDAVGGQRFEEFEPGVPLDGVAEAADIDELEHIVAASRAWLLSEFTDDDEDGPLGTPAGPVVWGGDDPIIS
jgi:hypothetical protein